MQSERSLQPTPQLILGIGLVVFGLLILLDRLHILDANVGLRFWPVAIIALGASLIVGRRGSGSNLPGVVLMAVGVLFLVGSLTQVSVWGLFVPLVIILIGARLILHTSRAATVPAAGDRTGGPPGAIESPGSAGWVSVLSVLGGAKRTSSDRPLRGGDITSFMGGVQLDLRHAAIEPGKDVVLTVFAMLSSQELWVPSDWTVSLEVAPILGEVEDKRLPPLDPSQRAAPGGPRLIVKGVIVMSGLTIKS